ncbi:MAG: DUF4132 domain-containing protein [Bacteroidota bacterium]
MSILDFFKKKIPDTNAGEIADPQTSKPETQKETIDPFNPLFEKMITEYTALSSGRYYDVPYAEMPSYPGFKSNPDSVKKQWLFFIARVVIEVKKKHKDHTFHYYGMNNAHAYHYMRFKLGDDLQKVLLKTTDTITEEELAKLIHLYADNLDLNEYESGCPQRALISRAEQLCKGKAVSEILATALRRMLEGDNEYIYQDRRVDIEKIQLLLSAEPGMPFDPNDDWGQLLVSWLKNEQPEQKQLWLALMYHCIAGGSKSSPTEKWMKESEKLVSALGSEKLIVKMQEWLAFNEILIKEEHKERGWHKGYLKDVNAQLLKGLIWCCIIPGELSLHRSLVDYANMAYKKKPGTGPLAMACGSACMLVFSRLPVKEGIPLLLAVRNKTDNKTILKTLDKLVSESAQKNGISPESIEEIAAPDFGMTSTGLVEKELGDFTCSLKVFSASNIELSFSKAGKEQSSVPAAIKKDYAVALKVLKQTQKSIEEQLRAHTERLESTYLKPREWSFDEWKSLYIDHPLLGIIGRKLIWHFTTGDEKQQGIYNKGNITNAFEKPLEGLGEKTTVQLWHPIGFDAGYVLDWRNYFRINKIIQPFKQAFREVYLVTDAELRTFSYSNRFAAHILRQHQFSALARQRGWNYTLMGAWDSHNTPVKLVHNWGIAVEFFVDSDWQGTTSESGVFTYIATDQVRFRKLGVVLNMDEIPAMVFTEIMRDVDLFVGVCSVGNDQNWTDGGDQQLNAYWRNYSFSELGESAKIRMESLQFLVPKMKIADQCSFDGKFLFVRGKLRTYKIHMGSGNILMEPNDQYLCIVPGGRNKDSDKIFLPFEGDTMLSIIISKALLLAADDKITDVTITRQLSA